MERRGNLLFSLRNLRKDGHQGLDNMEDSG